MKIHGLQKMTLLDYPGHVACTVFLSGCDMRCPFCHNFELADGSAKPVMDDEELLAFLKKRQGLLDGVAFTGGEPLLHRDIEELIRRIRAMGFRIKLDTNGCHPDMLKRLLDGHLIDYAAMDIKNNPGKYAVTAGLKQFDLSPVLESIRLLKESDIDYEFRTTVIAEFHEEKDFYEIGEMIRGARHYYLQCFTDRETVPFKGLHAPSADALRTYEKIMQAYVKDTHIRGLE